MTILVSIVVPYRDASRFLPGLIDNVKRQTYAYWECLLIDHCSVDGGDSLARELVASDFRFRCLSVPYSRENVAPRPAIPRNFALDRVSGELISFLDVDDRWHPEKLERQVKFHRQNNLDLSVTAYSRTRAHRFGGLTWRCPPSALDLRRLRRSNAVPMLTVMVAAPLLQAPHYGESPLRFLPVRHEDYVLWLQLWRKFPGLRYGCLSDLLAVHQRHGNNLTGKRITMLAWLYQAYRASGEKAPVAALLAISCAARQAWCSLAEASGWRHMTLTAEQLTQFSLVTTQ